MRYHFTGKNISIYDEVKVQAEKKIDRIQKLVPEHAEVFVAISKNRHLYKVEVSIPLHKRWLRAEVTADEINACWDSVVDILEKQIVKYKGRLKGRNRRKEATIEEVSFIEVEDQRSEEDAEVVIRRTKRFALKPMDAQEAVMEMELLGHSFFVFRNGVTDEVNVVYKRADEEYGLIEPE
ncbi:MAG: ribosome-associated translation inhibitor RaiA [Defluviitaleaceae bacterium]|nr:ribosome-associated translation inhibitor RaiA [Defluviitaleaceae bacterium]